MKHEHGFSSVMRCTEIYMRGRIQDDAETALNVLHQSVMQYKSATQRRLKKDILTRKKNEKNISQKAYAIIMN